jgi:hypothetical protein
LRPVDPSPDKLGKFPKVLLCYWIVGRPDERFVTGGTPVPSFTGRMVTVSFGRILAEWTADSIGRSDM